MDHDTLLRMLLGLKQKRELRLVSRLVAKDVRVTAGKAWFFLPDFHLLSKRAAKKYKFGFAHDEGGPVAREALLDELCAALRKLGAGQGAKPDLFVYHLGDFVDIWREDRVHPGEDLAHMVRRVLDDNPAANRWLVPESALGALLVIGNHDHIEDRSLRRVPATRRVRVAFALPPTGDVIVTHGDLFDPIEELPDRFSRWGSRFTEHVESVERKLRGALLVDSPSDVGPSPAFAVDDDHGLLHGAARYALALRRGDQWALSKMSFRSKKPAKVFVVGHTHWARIARRTPELTIMDCGAWLERCEVGGAKSVPSCQVGVIAQTAAGADMRIYQLTPHLA